MSIRVLVADDHKVVREGLSSLLEKYEGIEIATEAENGRKAVDLALELKPDVVMMDIAMPDLNGFEATRKIKAEAPDIKVLGLSIHSDIQHVEGMLEAGASGYVLKDCGIEEIVHAIRTIADNGTYLCSRIRESIVSNYLEHLSQTEIPGKPTLTPKEREVLQLIAEGANTKEIASRMQASVKTVETHRRHIMEKLETHSVADLTKHAIRQGLTSLDF